MKTKRTKNGGDKIRYKTQSSPSVLRDAALELPVEEESMVRTQIYLSRAEQEFVQREAARRNVPMAAVIRQFIDERMEAPDNAWTNNPMLAPSTEDPEWVGHQDAAINHDHYVYGAPKKFIKSRGKWVEAPPLPEDFYDAPGDHSARGSKLEKSK